MDKSKLQRILDLLPQPDNGLNDAFKTVEKAMTKVVENIRKEHRMETVDMAKQSISGLKNDIRTGLDALMDSFANLKQEFDKNSENLANALEDRIQEHAGVLSEFKNANGERFNELGESIVSLESAIKDLSTKKAATTDLTKSLKKVEEQISAVVSELKQESVHGSEALKTALQSKIDKVNEDLKELRKDAMSAIAGSHGGNANRNISIGGNSSTLSRYTDINFKPGNNITLSYTSNDNLKTTDITIAATGGGTSRSISTVSVSSVVAATAATDIVIIANQGILLTLPTAVGNTNLYTIKNTSTSSIMILADGSETIDGSANIILPVQYTSVDLISDNANFQIT